MTAQPPTPRSARRTRLLARPGAAGVGLGAAAFLALLTLGDPATASRKAFALGALAFGFGLLGWSGSVLAGDGFEHLQEHLDVRTGWTEASSRRVMARFVGFGAGWMLGSSVVSAVLA